MEVAAAGRVGVDSTMNYRFEQPEAGKIAVKVVYHYGDEVLKVYEL
jgi:hypothetical protein